MTVATDPVTAGTGYAHPEYLVSAAWLAEHLDDPGLVVVACSEDTTVYETGHIAGSVKVNWHTDLNDQITRDYLDAAEFARMCSAKGIGRDDTVVFYGDNANWWATYALWVFTLFGHPDLRLLDGGRDKWIADGRPMTTRVDPRPPAVYPEPVRDDAPIRAFRDQIMAHVALGRPLVDVRSPEEYTGELLHMPDYPQEGALRAGHVPGAVNKPWEQAVNDDCTFKSPAELRREYADELGLAPEDDVIVYCRIGERAAHTWFVLNHLLGYPQVRNYDGSWTEWGNLVRTPIAQGPEPGATTRTRR